ncbi:hypothetical protein OAP14_02660 [Aliiglaciecola sp.]|nr:hypothetical protein [Aliiglaciecola sp.]
MKNTSSDHYGDMINQVAQHIYDNCEQPITLSTLSDQFQVSSQSVFFRPYKHEFG